MPLNPQKLCQVEIETENLEQSLAFYENVFGWHPVPAEIFEVTVLAVPDHCPFGMSLVKKRHQGSRANGLILYFAVEDPAPILRSVEAFGGKCCFGPKKLHGYGEIYHIEDPSGIRWGLFVKP